MNDIAFEKRDLERKLVEIGVSIEYREGRAVFINRHARLEPTEIAVPYREL